MIVIDCKIPSRPDLVRMSETYSTSSSLDLKNRVVSILCKAEVFIDSTPSLWAVIERLLFLRRLSALLQHELAILGQYCK